MNDELSEKFGKYEKKIDIIKKITINIKMEK